MNNQKYKTAFGDDTNSKIAAGFCTNKNKEEIKKQYCTNCHREITPSNYTGTNLCVECKNYYYNKSGNYKTNNN